MNSGFNYKTYADKHVGFISGFNYKAYADKYVSFLKKLERKGVDITSLFKGDSTEKKSRTFQEIFEFVGKLFSKFYSKFINRCYNISFEDFVNNVNNFIEEPKYSQILTDLANFKKGKHISVVGDKITLKPLGTSNFTQKYIDDIILDIDTYHGFFDGIITTDGKFYFSRYSHEMLIKILIAHGVNLKGALRVGADHLNFWMSSLKEYKYLNEKFIKDSSIELTKQQAQTLIDLYIGLRKQPYHNSINLVKAMRCTENLGWLLSAHASKDKKMYDTYIANKNLDLIYETIVAKCGKDSASRRDLNILSLALEIEESNKTALGCGISTDI